MPGRGRGAALAAHSWLSFTRRREAHTRRRVEESALERCVWSINDPHDVTRQRTSAAVAKRGHQTRHEQEHRRARASGPGQARSKRGAGRGATTRYPKWSCGAGMDEQTKNARHGPALRQREPMTTDGSTCWLGRRRGPGGCSMGGAAGSTLLSGDDVPRPLPPHRRQRQHVRREGSGVPGGEHPHLLPLLLLRHVEGEDNGPTGASRWTSSAGGDLHAVPLSAWSMARHCLALHDDRDMQPKTRCCSAATSPARPLYACI